MSESNWGPCPTGALSKHAEHVRRQQRREMLGSALSGAAILAVPAAAAWMVARRDTWPADESKLACRDVLNVCDAYVAHTLDPQLAHRIEQHLVRCQSCHHFYAEHGADLHELDV